jgi:starch phosphorylase
VRDYTDQHYVPGAAAYRQRAENKGAKGKQIVDWQRSLEKNWAAIRLGQVHVETNAEQHEFEVQVYLDDLDPACVRVELFADGAGGNPIRQEMERNRPLAGEFGAFAYRGVTAASRPAGDFTVRVIPSYSGAAIPLEAAPILWQR